MIQNPEAPKSIRYYPVILTGDGLRLDKSHSCGLPETVGDFVQKTGSYEKAAVEIKKHTGLVITAGMLWKAAQGKLKNSSRLAWVFAGRKQDKRKHEYRPRHSLKRLHRLITDDAAWEAHREELRREYEKRVNL